MRRGKALELGRPSQKHIERKVVVTQVDDGGEGLDN